MIMGGIADLLTIGGLRVFIGLVREAAHSNGVKLAICINIL